jgi:alpha,alpha-trehalase
LAWCLKAYFDVTQDLAYVEKVMPFLERELDFFMKNKLINQIGWKSHLFLFRVVATTPRPESYREDMEASEHFEDLLQKQRLWGDIAAGAESGRDFSIRWFGNGPQAGKMSSIRTSSILPVELNAIICGNLRIFSEFYNLLGQPEKAQIAYGQFQLMREAIHQVFWNEEHGCWFDYDLEKKCQIELFFDTNLFPLFTQCYHEDLDGSRIVNYLTKTGVLNYSGIPTSLINSGEQWDFPSGWAPMNWTIIIGLKAIGQIELAKTLAAKWVAKNYLIYINSGGRMFEKYNVAEECFKARGGGGEYELQEGFGWTNGVILDLLNEFRDDLVFDTQSQNNVKCECCRPKPVETIITPSQESVDIIPPLTIEEQKTALATVIAAELIAASEFAANISETAVMENESPMIKAA